jgi:hypothetical protein
MFVLADDINNGLAVTIANNVLTQKQSYCECCCSSSGIACSACCPEM